MGRHGRFLTFFVQILREDEDGEHRIEIMKLLPSVGNQPHLVRTICLAINRSASGTATILHLAGPGLDRRRLRVTTSSSGPNKGVLHLAAQKKSNSFAR